MLKSLPNVYVCGQQNVCMTETELFLEYKTLKYDKGV